MKKEFLINLVLLVGINLLIKPFYAFGIDLQVQNKVGSEAYGLYFALLNFSYLFQIISDMGLQQLNSRMVSQSPKTLEKYLPSILLLKGFLALAFMLLTTLFAVLLGYSASAWHLLGFLLFNQVLITLIFFLRSNISGLQHYRLDSLLSALDKVLMILLMGLLLLGPWKGGFTIYWFAYAQTASFAITALVVWVVLYRKLKNPLRFRYQPQKFRYFLRKSYPYALAVFLMMTYTRVDAVMLERMLDGVTGDYEAGVYAYGYRFLDAFNMIGYLFASLLLPMFAKMLQQKEPMGDLLRTAFQWMFFLTISLSFAILFFGNDLTYWILRDANDYFVQVLILLVWSSNAVGLIYIAGPLLTANDSLKLMNRIFALGLLLNIVLNAILIPFYGAMGAAIATIATQGMVALAEIGLVFRLMPALRQHFFLSDLLKLLLLCLGLCLFYGGMFYYSDPFLDWRLAVVIAGLIGLVWAQRIGFLELKGIFGLFKSKRL